MNQLTSPQFWSLVGTILTKAFLILGGTCFLVGTLLEYAARRDKRREAKGEVVPRSLAKYARS